jgi:hypothetical protein
MSPITAFIELNRPVEEVFAYVTNPTRSDHLFSCLSGCPDATSSCSRRSR